VKALSLNFPASFKDYLELTKPRVVLLMWITAFVSMFLASPSGVVPWSALIFGSLGIVLAASAGAAINHLIDHRIDAIMARTHRRPIPTGRVSPTQVIIFAALLIASSMLVLTTLVNLITAILSLLTFIGYAGIYTVYLKRATPQNIVIGGLAGAMPPLLGWVAVTGHVTGPALLLVLIIFTWTPPHFWALAISRRDDYAKADIPMLPVTHGIQFTKLNVVLYTILLTLVTYLPFVINATGLIYVIGITPLNLLFMIKAIRLYRTDDLKYGYAVFRYSIYYLGFLFVLLLLDHYLPIAL